MTSADSKKQTNFYQIFIAGWRIIGN